MGDSIPNLHDLSHQNFVGLVQSGKYRILVNPSAAPQLARTSGILPTTTRLSEIFYSTFLALLLLIGMILCFRSMFVGGFVTILALIGIIFQQTGSGELLARHAVESEQTYLALVRGGHLKLIPLAAKSRSARSEPPPRSRAPRGSSEEARHAHVLGLTGKTTMNDVKAAYRTRIAEYHPDRVSHLGPKLRALAEEECKQINAAYEFFVRKYGRPD